MDRACGPDLDGREMCHVEAPPIPVRVGSQDACKARVRVRIRCLPFGIEGGLSRGCGGEGGRDVFGDVFTALGALIIMFRL